MMSSIMTTFLALEAAISEVVLAPTDGGSRVSQKKSKRKNIKACLIDRNLKKLVLVFI